MKYSRTFKTVKVSSKDEVHLPIIDLSRQIHFLQETPHKFLNRGRILQNINFYATKKNLFREESQNNEKYSSQANNNPSNDFSNFSNTNTNNRTNNNNASVTPMKYINPNNVNVQRTQIQNGEKKPAKKYVIVLPNNDNNPKIRSHVIGIPKEVKKLLGKETKNQKTEKLVDETENPIIKPEDKEEVKNSVHLLKNPEELIGPFSLEELFPSEYVDDFFTEYLKKNAKCPIENYKNNPILLLSELTGISTNPSDPSSPEKFEKFYYELFSKLEQNYFIKNLAKLSYFSSKSRITPDSKFDPYSNFASYIPEINNFNFNLIHKSDNFQIIFFSNDKNKDKSKNRDPDFALKRSFIKFDPIPFNLSEGFKPNEECCNILKMGKQFLEHNYNECSFINELNNNKEKVKDKVFQEIISFNTVYLSEVGILLFEVLSKLSGLSIYKYEPFIQRDPEFPLQLADRLIEIAILFESQKAGQYYFKPENLIIEFLSNNEIEIKLMDFEMVLFRKDTMNDNLSDHYNKSNDYLNKNNDSDFLIQLGMLKNKNKFPTIYTCPEILKIFKKDNSEDSEVSVGSENSGFIQKKPQINISKSNVYSIGMILLEALGFFDIYQIEITDLTSMKKNEIEYGKFLDLIDQFYNEKGKFLKAAKLMAFIKFCISYNPDDRLLASEINQALQKNISQSAEEEISRAYSTLRKPVKDAVPIKINPQNNFQELPSLLENVQSILPGAMNQMLSAFGNPNFLNNILGGFMNGGNANLNLNLNSK